jgi:hypothetical protein
MIEHTIIKEKNYAYIVVKQSPDFNAFVKASLNFVMDPGFAPALNRLCDFSQADLSHVEVEDLNAYAAFAKTSIPVVRSTRVALVTPSENRLGLFKAFADSINSIASGYCQTFVDPVDASVWLSEAVVADAQTY